MRRGCNLSGARSSFSSEAVGPIRTQRGTAMSSETTPLRAAEQETDPHLPAEGTGSLRDPFPGEFGLERRLGQGAFGEVWLARDLSPLARLVALKFLRLAGSPARREQALALLHNEARVLAALSHPNIVQVHAWKQPADTTGPCLVLQYVPGGSLADRVREQGPLPWELGGRYIADVAEGLLLVHGKGIIHRDVKPANVLLDPDRDEALLTDFGIAARLVDAGLAAGTPLFMAPEAFRGEVSPAQDVYGLAASLFWLVAGSAPFDGRNEKELLAAIERGLPPHEPRLAALPGPLDDLLRAGLSCRAADRPALPEFVRRLRGTLNRLLADSLPLSPLWERGPGGEGNSVNLRLVVSR